ncbi:hypothetical protein WJX84_003784 [Apatococcus fuscideae]|uniref:RRM domain-containing protein n=1 Tax=Apatococcus fuscideae TaxID=2026836 RepID=A0AAW1SWX8_9CHLO
MPEVPAHQPTNQPACKPQAACSDRVDTGRCQAGLARLAGYMRPPLEAPLARGLHTHTRHQHGSSGQGHGEWEGQEEPLMQTGSRGDAIEPPASFADSFCNLRQQEVPEDVLKSFEDLLRAGGPPLSRRSLEGARRSFSEFPLRERMVPARDARSDSSHPFDGSPPKPHAFHAPSHNRSSHSVHGSMQGPRQYHSHNPLSPKLDPMQSSSNLSTFSSLGHEGSAAPLDSTRYSTSLSSFGSTGYSSGYGRHQGVPGGGHLSGIMSTGQSLMSTGQSMSGMMSTSGGLMSTGQSSGTWSEHEGRDPAGFSQAPGLRAPSASARMHGSLGFPGPGRKRYTTHQNPFARTHSVDSALINPELLDTPPQLGVFSASTGMPSLLETSDSQGPVIVCQVWVGNLLPDVSRQDVLAVLERFGPVQDVIVFPGHSYAIANFLAEGDAVQAVASLQDQRVPSISGQSQLILSFKDERGPLGPLSADIYGHSPPSRSPEPMLHQDFGGRPAPLGERHPPNRQGEWEGATVPSSRIWLGNIAATATQRCVRQIFGKFGHLTDAAVFPARIGPLGYAFVNFEQVAHAMRAYDMLNNAVVPLLTGNKQLKMRFKPAKENEAGPSSFQNLAWTCQPMISRHLKQACPPGA